MSHNPGKSGKVNTWKSAEFKIVKFIEVTADQKSYLVPGESGVSETLHTGAVDKVDQNDRYSHKSFASSYPFPVVKVIKILVTQNIVYWVSLPV